MTRGTRMKMKMKMKIRMRMRMMMRMRMRRRRKRKRGRGGFHGFRVRSYVLGTFDLKRWHGWPP